MGILERFKTKKGEEKVSMPAKAVRETGAGDVKEKSGKAGSGSAGKAATKKAAAKKSETASSVLRQGLEGVILRPMVTEKAAHLASTGQYVFSVHPDANRIQIRSAVGAMYGVLPVSVNIQVVRGKVVRFGRSNGKRKNWKKAIVTLPKGKTIDIYAGV